MGTGPRTLRGVNPNTQSGYKLLCEANNIFLLFFEGKKGRLVAQRWHATACKGGWVGGAGKARFSFPDAVFLM